jgi:hypothetical protein
MEKDFPNSSDKAREENVPADDSRAPKIIEGKAVQRKKPFMRRLRETFIAGDVVNMKEYLVFDVLVPAVRDMITDALIQGVERTFKGDIRSATRRSTQRSGPMRSHISYNRAADSPLRRNEPREVSRYARANHDFNEIILDTFAEAEMVIERMQDALEKYGKVSVADLYNFVGITPTFTDEKWGWIDLRNAGVSRLRGSQYLLNLPDPDPIRS